ncbi:MAG: hypothetical protein IPK64_12275 [bacterium]|nr:hypothetical protein [bacterium]
MLVTHSVRGDGKGESKPRNKRKYDEGVREKFKRDGLDGRPGQKLPKRARGGDDDAAEVDDEDEFDEEDDFDLDEDDDFDMDEDDDFEVDGDDDWDKDDD